MDFKNNKAIYLQIADYVCEQILLGTWKTAERIPSVRELAVNLEVNPNTVVKTYGHLVDEGIIHMKRGIGYFAADNAKSKIKQLKRNAFMKHELPDIFKSMDLLDIDFNEIQTLYQKRKTS